jgi:hypothetical protein
MPAVAMRITGLENEPLYMRIKRLPMNLVVLNVYLYVFLIYKNTIFEHMSEKNQMLSKLVLIQPQIVIYL